MNTFLVSREFRIISLHISVGCVFSESSSSSPPPPSSSSSSSSSSSPSELSLSSCAVRLVLPIL
uniref:Uncharacterized protein n=1 Tax=Trichobilharzia regenti TaxID=157069 RepID=A0AA85K1L2_TRIRE|nr:unnamed protein product [Trichobilharzia regenti]